MILELPPELTIARAAELRATLISGLERGEALELNASQVTEVDAAGLQVLCAAHRSAQARGLGLTFAPGTRSDVLRETIVAAGLGRHGEERWLLEEASLG